MSRSWLRSRRLSARYSRQDALYCADSIGLRSTDFHRCIGRGSIGSSGVGERKQSGRDPSEGRADSALLAGQVLAPARVDQGEARLGHGANDTLRPSVVPIRVDFRRSEGRSTPRSGAREALGAGGIETLCPFCLTDQGSEQADVSCSAPGCYRRISSASSSSQYTWSDRD